MGLIRVTIRGLLSQLDGFAGLLSAQSGPWCHAQRRSAKRAAPLPAAVRRIMRKHRLSAPSARTYVLLAHGEAALHG
jgi:hypothetical protein